MMFRFEDMEVVPASMSVECDHSFLIKRFNKKHIKHYFTIKSTRADIKIIDFMDAAKLELDEFFKFKSYDPFLFFINNRKDMNLIFGQKTEKWFVGAMKNNIIYIFHPNIFAKISSHKKEKFWQTLKHEYCHVYYTQITNSHYPLWLNEGLASYISGKKLILKNECEKNLLNVFKYFDAMDRDGYMIGQYWVEYLLQNFGKEKFLRLIKNIHQKTDSKKFADLFYKIYDFKYNKNTFRTFIS